jgi:hypothetical protein
MPGKPLNLVAPKAAPHVHTAQVMDRAEPFDDHLRLRHADGIARVRPGQGPCARWLIEDELVHG